MGQRWKPVIGLAVLAPVVVDVVFGATTVSTPFALVPEVLTYGVGAVLVRENVRSGRRGVAAIALLGAAFALLSECVVVQTSVAPQPGDTGRMWGVTWPYLVFMVGWIAVWAFLVPIRIVETACSGRPETAGPWLGRRARTGFGVLFVLGCVVAWHQWTRVVRPRFLGLPVADPPWPTIVAALVAVALLAALAATTPWPGPGARRPPRPVLIGATVVFATALWTATTLAAPAWLPPAAGVVAALLVAAATASAFAAWTASPEWSPAHRLAAVAGALVANSAAGFVLITFRSLPDLAGKIVVDAAAVGIVAWLARRERVPAAGR